jgi:hypothetical protein
MASPLGFTVVPGTLSITEFNYCKRLNIPGYIGPTRICPFQELQYIVQDNNGAQFRNSIIWNMIETYDGGSGSTTYPLSADQSEMLRQATLREKEYRGHTLSVDELYALRFSNAIPETRILSRVMITPPTPTPTITPTAIAATLTDLQSQISKLTGEIVTLRAQLQEATGDKARLTQQLAETQAQLLALTDSFRLLLTQQ